MTGVNTEYMMYKCIIYHLYLEKQMFDNVDNDMTTGMVYSSL